MMREAASTSPFAALSNREQMERWACWHSQKMQEKPTGTLLESVSCDEKPTEELYVYRPRHSQYDAVVRRMQQAGRQALHYTNCNSCGITRQD